MITLFRSDKTYTLTELKNLMAEHIKQLPAKVSSIGECLKVIRYELRCEPINILSWLHNQKTSTKVYWSNRKGDFEIGGIGIADGLKGGSHIDYKELFTYMEDRLSSDNPHLHYYGGINFHHTNGDADWQEFGTFQFIIPQFEIVQTGGHTTFAFNITIENIQKANIDSIIEDLDRIDFSPQTQYRKVPQILARKDFPDQKEWTKIFQDAHDDKGALKHHKIVLARKSVFDFDILLRSDALLKHLKDRTPNCYHFCFQFSSHSAFLGATPERLYERNQKNIKSEAIAGTRPRGDNKDHDALLEQQLLNSEKDTLEHKYVVDAIRSALEPLCASLKSADTFELKKLKGSQHLSTRFEGLLKEGVDDCQILESLHPTPAVAGTPAKEAMTVIEQLEPFGRGWYAGPVGFVGYDQSEFAVAIRCGLIHGDQLALYAGAGIVEGSTAQEEWDEIENKISNFMKVFNQTT